MTNLIDKLKETKESIKYIAEATFKVGPVPLYAIPSFLSDKNNKNFEYEYIKRRPIEPVMVASSLGLTAILGYLIYETPWLLALPAATNVASYVYEKIKYKRARPRANHQNIQGHRADNIINAAPVNHPVQNQGYRANRIDALVDEQIKDK